MDELAEPLEKAFSDVGLEVSYNALLVVSGSKFFF
jgi:hypothetical protein